MNQQAPTRFSATGQVIHWLTAIIVLIAFIYGPGGREARIYAPTHDFDRQLHETLGLCVFTLVVLRVFWRAFTTRPAPPEDARWMELSAKLVQGALYVLLIILPLTAITGAWLEGHPLTLMGGFHFAPMLAKSHALGADIAELHGWLGDAILWLAGLHAAAGLFHHFILKDDVLRSMLPQWIIGNR